MPTIPARVPRSLEAQNAHDLKENSSKDGKSEIRISKSETNSKSQIQKRGSRKGVKSSFGAEGCGGGDQFYPQITQIVRQKKHESRRAKRDNAVLSSGCCDKLAKRHEQGPSEVLPR